MDTKYGAEDRSLFDASHEEFCVKIHCPKCEHKFKVKVRRSGRFGINCPSCAYRVRVEIEILAHVLDADGARLEESQAVRAQTKEFLSAMSAASASGLHLEATLPADSDVRLEATLPSDAGLRSGAMDSAAVSPSEAAMEAEVTMASDPAVGSDITFASADLSRGDDSSPDISICTSQIESEGVESVPSREQLGGYRVVKELGQGAMGTVYLARQVSLDRDVAIKTIKSEYASEPRTMARFTREAYAAAQLNHPNVVQIYDMGRQDGTSYFSMEFVKGFDLRTYVKKSGKLAPDMALQYTLQAARGLKHAHDFGMVHRDVKPENLLISDDGFVKVADLGLIKLPKETPQHAPTDEDDDPSGDVGLTRVGYAMGTPAYMAPEQAGMPTEVDHRADIYSLGCTLYTLLTGNPPFNGTSIEELITKHKSEPMVRPDHVLKHIPSELGELTLRMTEKDPKARYQSMDQLIDDIQHYLGIRNPSQLSLDDQNVQQLEESCEKLGNDPVARISRWISLLFLPTMILGVLGGSLLSATLGQIGPSVVVFSFVMLVSSLVTHITFAGLAGRSVLFRRLKQLIFGARWIDWTAWAIGFSLVVGLALFADQWVPLIVSSLVGALGAAVVWFCVDRKIHKMRDEVRKEVEPMLKRMRLMGVDEQAVQGFVAEYGGSRWEELFEAIFGYDEKIAQRERLIGQERFRRMPKFAAWRDPLVRWLDQKIERQQRQKEKKHLEKIETESLQAEGKSALEARSLAQSISNQIVEEASRVRAGERVEGSPLARRLQRKQAYQAARRAAMQRSTKQRLEGWVSGLLAPMISGKTSLLLGTMLLALFGYRVYQSQSVEESSDLMAAVGQMLTEPMPEANVPYLASNWLMAISGPGALFAGLLLYFSWFAVESRKAALCIAAGSAACVLGVPEIESLSSVVPPSQQGIVVGLGIATVGAWVMKRIPIPLLSDDWPR